MKIQQMAFMLMAVVLFFLLVVLFYMAFQSRNMGQKAEELRETKANTVALMLSRTPEFSCGDFCIDTDRLMVLMSRENYNNFWAVSKIKVVELYPRDGLVECTMQNYPNCDVYSVYDKNKKGSSTENYITLCRRENLDGGFVNICRLGKIIVGFESI